MVTALIPMVVVYTFTLEPAVQTRKDRVRFISFNTAFIFDFPYAFSDQPKTSCFFQLFLVPAGGHYYSSDLPMDPWSEIRYPGTNGNGIAKFGACVDVGYDLSDGALVGKAFVVHKNNGGRVSCGIIEEVTTSSSKNKKSSKSRR